MSSLGNDKRVSELAGEFIRQAANAERRGALRSAPPMSGFRISEAGLYDFDAALVTALQALSHYCAGKLGARLGDEKEIESAAWTFGDAFVLGPKTDAALAKVAKDFAHQLDARASIAADYIAGNHLFVLPAGIDSLSIGPVTIASGATEASRQNKKPFATSVGARLEANLSRKTLTLPRTVWRVHIVAAAGHRTEEAIWLINIATGLFRLLVLPRLSQPTPRWTSIGDIESHPTRGFHDDRYIVVPPKGGVTVNGWKASGIYEINHPSVLATKRAVFKRQVDRVFSSGSSTLGARFGQGLGWMSRGRQATDRSDRFLAHFTAIEALMTSDDKSAPITQTISRNAAALLYDLPDDRMRIAQTLTDLYGVRSALVHAGRRLVTTSQVNELQRLAEALFITVGARVDLGITHQNFVASFRRPGFGAKWKSPARP